MVLFESRENRDGTFYVVAAGSGQLAHTEDAEGAQRAAVGLDRDRAQEVAQRLNSEARGAS